MTGTAPPAPAPAVRALPTARHSAGGRPRSSGRRRPGATAGEEVLDAAAELFTTRGYAATSTRQIAEAVGIRQASLYHHFRTKDDILTALLRGTVTRPLAACRLLAERPDPAAVQLHALALVDSRQLWESAWNVGLLYLLPEVRTERFARFHRERDELRTCYRQLAREVLAGLPPAGDVLVGGSVDDDVVFRLTETLPNLRADGLGRPDEPLRTADLGLHALGWRGDPVRLRAASLAAVEEVTRRRLALPDEVGVHG